LWIAAGVVLVTLVAGYLVTDGLDITNASASEPEEQEATATQDGEDQEAAAEDEASEDEKDQDKKEGNGKEKAPIPVTVFAAAVGSVSSYLTATANLVAENDVLVLAEAEGRVAELMVEEGDWVESSEVLASLVRDDEEIALTKAQLRLTNAGIEYERAGRLVKEELLSQEEYDKAEMEKELAQQELQEADLRLSRTYIRAPFRGRITERRMTLGQHIRPGDELFAVTDFDPLVARIYVPEKDVLSIAEGRDVRITLRADDSVGFRGRIRQISPVVDTATGTVKVTIEAHRPPPQVRPGSFVTVDIIRETHAEAVLLPREAVIRELQKTYVFVTEGETAEKRNIALGLEEGKQVEVLSGITVGEQVIVAGQGGLRDGSVIKILDSDATEES
jgi:membrane fusion protein (multidrug efflux system)